MTTPNLLANPESFGAESKGAKEIFALQNKWAEKVTIPVADFFILSQLSDDLVCRMAVTGAIPLPEDLKRAILAQQMKEYEDLRGRRMAAYAVLATGIDGVNPSAEDVAKAVKFMDSAAEYVLEFIAVVSKFDPAGVAVEKTAANDEIPALVAT